MPCGRLVCVGLGVRVRVAGVAIFWVVGGGQVLFVGGVFVLCVA